MLSVHTLFSCSLHLWHHGKDEMRALTRQLELLLWFPVRPRDQSTSQCQSQAVSISSLPTDATHSQPPSTLPVLPESKEQPKRQLFLALNLSKLSLLQKEDRRGKGRQDLLLRPVFIPFRLDSPLNSSGLECPARGPRVSPGSADFPCLGHYTSADTFEEAEWCNYRDVAIKPDLGPFYGYFFKNVHQTILGNSLP